MTRETIHEADSTSVGDDDSQVGIAHKEMWSMLDKAADQNIFGFHESGYETLLLLKEYFEKQHQKYADFLRSFTDSESEHAAILPNKEKEILHEEITKILEVFAEFSYLMDAFVRTEPEPDSLWAKIPFLKPAHQADLMRKCMFSRWTRQLKTKLEFLEESLPTLGQHMALFEVLKESGKNWGESSEPEVMEMRQKIAQHAYLELLGAISDEIVWSYAFEGDSDPLRIGYDVIDDYEMEKHELSGVVAGQPWPMLEKNDPKFTERQVIYKKWRRHIKEYSYEAFSWFCELWKCANGTKRALSENDATTILTMAQDIMDDLQNETSYFKDVANYLREHEGESEDDEVDEEEIGEFKEPEQNE